MLQSIHIEEEIKKSYLEYSLSVIIGRALPDVRDGLKPVHRRILYAMHDLGNTYNRPYKKSARIVGDVIGKYHPHGDAAVYDALVRMAQDFNMRHPLVDGQGNFGSLDGDAPAAMRYTESRMARISGEFLADIDKQTVNFRANYDNTLHEPEVLPTKVPNLLVNGASGIAVGMATNIPPHNLGEVTDALLALLDDPSLGLDQLLHYIKGPDFPTAALMYGRQGMRQAYATGRGSIKLRSRLHVEESKKGRESIVITEIPFALNKASLVEKIAQLVNEGKLEGISDLRDESDRNGIRIVIDLKRNTLSDIVINTLYKYTALETSYGINLLAVVNNRPQLLSLKQILELFLEHRKEVILRRSRYDLDKAEKRAHILEGLRIALDNIDEVVRLIRASATPAEAKAGLMQRFELSEVQSQAILDMRLHRLTNLERDKLLEEYRAVLERIEYLKSIIEQSEVLRGVVRDELQELRKTFASPRRTEILESDPNEIDIEDLIPDEEVVITLTRNGYIKRTPLSAYQQQKRGGKGVSGANVAQKDFVTDLMTGTNHQYLLLFTNKGRMHQLKVYQIPEGRRTARGTHIANLLPLDKEEYVATVLCMKDFDANHSFLFATKKGMVKRSAVHLYRNYRPHGLIAVNLRDGDELIAVREVDEESEIFLITHHGVAIRFACSEVRSMGRGAAGVKGIALRQEDAVVSCVIINGDGRDQLLTVSEQGYGKRTAIDYYRQQSRGGKGIINMRLTSKTGGVLGAMMVDETDELIMLTSMHKMLRIGTADIRICGRATQGVKLVSLDSEATVVCFDRIVSEEALSS
ncbi:DNA gyrase subunit A [Desulfohalobium retbaense]|uniref:DNA gyrase subunit A n=1 Tax=Desulfohalobium retbaense (strain ATCC 49708 / DSM 5692 / JCM 16813 / HR100) TaxID=485915 RepID=C8X5Q8_DESRD|nr:DNA gyrase, A subunit [Desulfohalobium retbaense DSM 5692]